MNNLNIIIYGEKSDKTLFNMLNKNLSTNFILSSICEEKIKLKNQADIMLIDTDNLTSMNIEQGIIILKNHCNLKNLNIKNKDNFIIVNSQNKAQLFELSNKHLKVITAGFYEKDTITFSSNNEDFCTISLQRSLKDFQNNIIEPMEVPLSKINLGDLITDYNLLAYATILILLNI